MSKVDRIDALKRAKLQGVEDVVGSSVINSEVVPGVTFSWKNTVSSEFQGRLFIAVELHQESAILGAARICNGDDILFNEVMLALLLQRPLLAILLGGTNEIGLQGLVIFQLLFEFLSIPWARMRFNEIEDSDVC